MTRENGKSAAEAEVTVAAEDGDGVERMCMMLMTSSVSDVRRVCIFDMFDV